VLVAIDYFTKWTKVVPLKNMTHKEVIHFISEHIIYRFDISQILTMNQGSSFMSHQVYESAESLKIKLLNSSLYNGQAESFVVSCEERWNGCCVSLCTFLGFLSHFFFFLI
jgi:hypothetical protein